MTLIRLIQRASLLAGLAFASFSVYGSPARSEQRVCIITDDGATMCGKITNSKRETKNLKQKNSGYRKEVNNIVYVLKGCDKSDVSVKCEFTITNKGVEKSIAFNRRVIDESRSTIIDSIGKSYQASSVNIGGESSGEARISVSPGIDYVAIFTFNNTPEQTTKFPILNLIADDQKIQFRNVSFLN
jgi:hypothetical protein